LLSKADFLVDRRTQQAVVLNESCDFSIVIGLRAAGHDVISIAESMRAPKTLR